MQTDTLKITGMHCGGCTNTVTRALKAVSGVVDVTVSLPTGEAIVQYDENLASLGQMKSAVEGAGYGVRLMDADSAPQSKGGCCGGKNATAGV